MTIILHAILGCHPHNGLSSNIEQQTYLSIIM